MYSIIFEDREDYGNGYQLALNIRDYLDGSESRFQLVLSRTSENGSIYYGDINYSVDTSSLSCSGTYGSATVSGNYLKVTGMQSNVFCLMSTQ